MIGILIVAAIGVAVIGAAALGALKLGVTLFLSQRSQNLFSAGARYYVLFVRGLIVIAVLALPIIALFSKVRYP